MGQLECGWKLKGAAIAVGLFLGCAVMCSLCGCSQTVQAKSRYVPSEQFGKEGSCGFVHEHKQLLPCCGAE